MELILNELSFDGQFQTWEDFDDYVRDILSPMLDVMIENRIPLLKKSDLYHCRITVDETLQDLLMMANDPVITLLKKSISNLAYCEPYWDTDMESDPAVCYEYPSTAEEPNCFTEVIAREGSLVSLPHPDYRMNPIYCKRDGDEITVANITDVKQLLKQYLLEDENKIRYILEQYPFERSVICAKVGGRCYAEEALLENGLITEDFIHIVEAIPKLIEDLRCGRKTHWWDKLQDDIFELRIDVSANRIFRILFIQKEEIYLLNGFIKKTQKTPREEIDRAIQIKKHMRMP